MILKFNGVEAAAYPAPGGFKVTLLDLHDADTTTRTSDGVFHGDVVRVIRQIDLSFNALTWPKMSALLKQIKDSEFDVYFPDAEEGGYITRRMYKGNRPASIPIEKDGELWWEGLEIVLTEV